MESGRYIDLAKACYYHNQKMGSCPYGNKWKFLHQLVKAEDKAKIRRPSSAGGSASSRQSTRTNGKGKSSSRGSSPGTPQSSRSGSTQIVCRDFAKGDCKHGDKCRFLHLSGAAALEMKNEVKRVVRRQAKASAATAALMYPDRDEPSFIAGTSRPDFRWAGDNVDGDYCAL